MAAARQPTFSRLGALGWGVALVTAGLATLAEAQEIRVRSGEYTAVPGGSIVLPVELEATEDVTGFSFGVTHDPSFLTLSEVLPTDDLLDAMNLAPGTDPSGDFFLIDTEPEGGDGFVVAAILGPEDATALLPPGTHHIFDVRYAAVDGADGTTDVSVTGDLGSPPVALVVDVDGGTAREFQGSGVEVGFADGYNRGDTDGDGSVNITDATRILRYLFQGGELGTCPPTLNTDGSVGAPGGSPIAEDLNDIQLTDAILLLNFLFRTGVAPAPPFGACGQSPAPLSAEMACQSFNGCP